nr:TIGR03936 family radical SAM-associated protein [uncultured Sellimonas sp.]
MKARIKFKKFGVMKFIGHLDVMRYFQKAMRRADIPIAFTQGFSPHMIMSFANPLGVGLTSDGEYFDIELTEPISTKEAVDRLNQVMVEGMKIVNFVQISDEKKATGMSIIEAADYLAIPKPGISTISSEEMEAFLKEETVFVVKQTKKSEKEVNIRPWIHEMKLQGESIFMKVCAGSSINLKPELVMDALLSFLKKQETREDYYYHRLENYAMSEGELVPLDALGTEIL